MSENNYDDMTVAELKATADVMGIEYTTRVSKAELISAIEAMVNGAADETVEAEKPVGPIKKDEERVTIIIDESDRDRQPVPVGVNGTMYVIPRGKKIPVPLAVLEVLNNAVEHKWDSEMKSRTEKPSYPYRVVM